MLEPSQEEIYNTLVKARRVQATQGRTWGALVDSQGVCMRGALIVAVSTFDAPVEVLLDNVLSLQRDKSHLLAACDSALGFELGRQMTSWNDHPERTLEEVLERFDEAIEALRPEPVFVPEEWTAEPEGVLS